jgi:hypothetical protein
VVGDAAYTAAITSLWDGRCTITVRSGVLNPDNGRTETQEQTITSDVPCRISYERVTATTPAEEAQRVEQTVTLLIANTTDIPAGSKITVTQNGVTRDYQQSGEAAVYSFHKEVPLVMFERWA